jgi:hypothetical protein
MADTRCPRCAVNPIADGYSVCERCAFWEWKPASAPGVPIPEGLR